jgi:nitrate reductase assembly molybdenum cofactor insertion protein NarJ
MDQEEFRTQDKGHSTDMLLHRLKGNFKKRKRFYGTIIDSLKQTMSNIENKPESNYKALLNVDLAGTLYLFEALEEDNDYIEALVVDVIGTRRALTDFQAALVTDLEDISSEIARTQGQHHELKETKKQLERIKRRIRNQNRKYKDVLEFLDSATRKHETKEKRLRKQLISPLTYIG